MKILLLSSKFNIFFINVLQFILHIFAEIEFIDFHYKTLTLFIKLTGKFHQLISKLALQRGKVIMTAETTSWFFMSTTVNYLHAERLLIRRTGL